ncbi:DinB family protein [Aequorivita sp. Q41]|uniref:DinB family protein n=1 Tax=Aequorivita sp. Q41 TaxID=3153300 RepID=UPI0032425505
MKNLVIILFGLFSSLTFSQQDTARDAFLEKWENSKNYLLAIAESMPEADFDYKPTEREMSFKAQLLHIEDNMLWLKNSYLLNKEVEKVNPDLENISKEEVIKSLTNSFDSVFKAVSELPDSALKETVAFFAGPKSKLQILNLLQDHVSHHRGQLIVYLNLKNVKPPKYVGW